MNFLVPQNRVGRNETAELNFGWTPSRPARRALPLAEDLAAFKEFGKPTRQFEISFKGPGGEARSVPAYVNEFWTARQRQAHSLHEVSYRACFKPQLPRFFIERLSEPGEIVYDPFMGRGTTLLESALLGRIPCGCDINPLSAVLVGPRLVPPFIEDVEERLQQIDFNQPQEIPEDLLTFYHPDTLRQIIALKRYLLDRQANHRADALDGWICLVALNRLTGHSAGFFSVYTLPPNQAVSIKSQKKINADRNQTPARRDVPRLILKKSRQLLGDCDSSTRQALAEVGRRTLLLTCLADNTPEIPSNSVALVVTSPPFLNVVDYATDNWLRCWFLGLDAEKVNLTVPQKLAAWQAAMTEVFKELHRVLKPGGHVAFEVGEVHSGKTKLEEAVLPCGQAAGLTARLVLINDQAFTKTANCWGVDNRVKGTNTNRIVVFEKSGILE